MAPYLVPHRELAAASGAARGTWLTERGAYWEARLRDEHDLRVPVGYRYRHRHCGELYGYTRADRRGITLHTRLLDVHPALVDKVLVHELIHAHLNGRGGHGPAFKRAYGAVYPWAKPGPVSDVDPGTPRRELWRALNRVLPRAALRADDATYSAWRLAGSRTHVRNEEVR